jgi:hypothetical protein
MSLDEMALALLADYFRAHGLLDSWQQLMSHSREQARLQHSELVYMLSMKDLVAKSRRKGSPHKSLLELLVARFHESYSLKQALKQQEDERVLRSPCRPLVRQNKATQTNFEDKM